MSDVKEAGKYAKIWLFIQDSLLGGFFPCLLFPDDIYRYTIGTGYGGGVLKGEGEMDGRRGSDQRFIMQA